MSRLRAGQWVEVRSLQEIRATLNADGALEGMPFMPEMARYSGQRFRVGKRAHKTCNTVDNTGNVRIERAVHLESVRCDGSGHDGCQAWCLIYWKEAWLKPVEGPTSEEAPTGNSRGEARLPERWSRRIERDGDGERVRYRCQITDIPRFSRWISPWSIRQYVEDIFSGNVDLRLFLRGITFSWFRLWLHHGPGHRVAVALFHFVLRRLRGGGPFPFEDGSLKKTPHLELGLQPGECVRVRSFEDIVATLDTSNKNRGLGFDNLEMSLHCNRTFRVKDRIERIINERTGEMLHFSNPCITLEGVYCTGETTERRLFCPRAITPYWREIWLERTSVPKDIASHRDRP